MKITFDSAKNAKNKTKHGLGFEQVGYFDWTHSLVEQDDRKDYGEDRYNAIAYIDDTLCFLTFIYRKGSARIISLRLANKKERERYGEIF
jgi:uncharacterized DUF497 family protein